MIWHLTWTGYVVVGNINALRWIIKRPFEFHIGRIRIHCASYLRLFLFRNTINTRLIRTTRRCIWGFRPKFYRFIGVISDMPRQSRTNAHMSHVSNDDAWETEIEKEKKRVNKFTIRDKIDNNNVYTWGGEQLGTVRAMSRPNHHFHFQKKNQFPSKLIILYLYLQFMLIRSFTHDAAHGTHDARDWRRRHPSNRSG